MATVSAFSILPSIRKPNSHRITNPSPSLSITLRNLRFRTHVVSNCFSHFVTIKKENKPPQFRKLRSAEEETQLTEDQQQQQEGTTLSESAEQQPTVSVSVSPSDRLTMFFQAEGTMNETDIPKVTKSLQETEGIANLKVQVTEGIASVEFMKQTTIQATGVASHLVEAIQGAGFKLQSLNLSFEEEEEVLV